MRNLALITDYSSKVKVNEEKRGVGILNQRYSIPDRIRFLSGGSRNVLQSFTLILTFMTFIQFKYSLINKT